MKRFQYYIVLGSMMATLFITCDRDHGLEPLRSGIQGVITFTGEWPTEPEEVRIIGATKFPPTDITELALGEKLPHDVDSYTYTNYMETGTYKILGVAWRPKGGNWALTSVCGLYFNETNSLFPGEVTIATENSIVEGINISVDCSAARQATDSRITGRINFDGAWPEEFTGAIVVASVKDPLSESFSLLDFVYSSAIPAETRSFDYSIEAPAATYKAIGVLFFKGDTPLTLDDLYYTQNLGGIRIEEFVVPAQKTVEGPTFNLQVGVVNSGMSGTVFFTGQWPAEPEEVRLITATSFPPAFDDLIVGDLLPSDADEHAFMFKLRPDAYKLVGVAWRATGTDWDIVSICGVHFAGNDSLAPAEVVIETDTSTVENVNIHVNRSKARKVTDTKITGSITFTDNWPQDITDARVIATTKFSLFPTVMPSLLDLSFSDQTIEPGTTSYDYEIKAFPGTFVATGVIFFKEGQLLSLTDILYSAEVGGLSLDPYDVIENETADGPDFEIQF